MEIKDPKTYSVKGSSSIKGCSLQQRNLTTAINFKNVWFIWRVKHVVADHIEGLKLERKKLYNFSTTENKSSQKRKNKLHVYIAQTFKDS